MELTPDVEWILGRPNFWCAPIAHRLVKLGLATIKPHAEEEQAYVLHWLLSLHEKHGATFRAEADKILNTKHPFTGDGGEPCKKCGRLQAALIHDFAGDGDCVK